jgi:hypothetical protein
MFGFGVFMLRVLTVLFFVGLAGSAVVVLISFVEDFKELFAPDDATESSHVHPGTTESGQAKPGYSQARQVPK